MSLSLRPLAALLLAAGLALPVSAQDDRSAPPEDKREIVIERVPAPAEEGGNVIRFRVPDGAPLLRHWRDGERPSRTDTLIDGRRVTRFRLPGGEEEAFTFEVPGFDAEDLRKRVMPQRERFRVALPDVLLERDGEPFGLRMRALMDGLDGPSEETRRAMMALERRAHALAAEARRAEGRERAEAVRALDEVLAELFEVRGRMREEQAARLEERAERLREEAEALRRALREREGERRALIEERKRALLGQPGADW